MDTTNALTYTTMVGLTSSIFLSGTYFSASQLTAPILYALPKTIASQFFDTLYHRGIPPIATLGAISALSLGTSAYLDPKRRSLYITGMVSSLLPLLWTRTVMASTIDRLLEISQKASVRELATDAEVVGLLKAWRFHNFIRAGMAGFGGGIALIAASL